MESELICPVCGEAVPLNQLGNEQLGHKADMPDLEWDSFIAAAEEGLRIV